MNVTRALNHLQRAEILLGPMSDKYTLGMLHWGLAMANLEAMRVNEALTASQKGMDILARLGDRESWSRVGS